MIKDCPDLPSVRKATRSRRIDKVEKRNSPQRQRRRSSPDMEELKELVKKLTLEVQSLKRTSRKRTSNKAFIAQEAKPLTSDISGSPLEGEEVDEVAYSTVKAKGKYPSSDWLLDSCASSHMTDQPSLFRELKPLQTRRWIKVSGGYLYATHIGKAVMGGRKGKQIVLKNILLIPSLRVNLVS